MRGRRHVKMHRQHEHRLQSKLAGHLAFKASSAHGLLKKATGMNRENGGTRSRHLLRAASVFADASLSPKQCLPLFEPLDDETLRAKDAVKFATSVLLLNVGRRGDWENHAAKKTLE